MTRPLRHYHLTILRELAAEDADIGRPEWTGCDAAAELEARGLLTFERDLYWITDAGRGVLADADGRDQEHVDVEDLDARELEDTAHDGATRTAMVARLWRAHDEARDRGDLEAAGEVVKRLVAYIGRQTRAGPYRGEGER